MSLVEVRGLSVELTGSRQTIVDDVTLAIGSGEVLALVGESGSGKTTVALSLLGDSRAGTRVAAGQVVIAGEDVFALAGKRLREFRGGVVSYIPQEPAAALNPALKIRTQIREVFEFHRTDLSETDIDARISETFATVRLPTEAAFLQRFPHQLSGGQLQRVAIAMTFVIQPSVIVLDEPTTGLDVVTQSLVLDTVRRLCAIHQVAALYVTHDLAVAANLAHSIAVMYAGRVVEMGPGEALLSSPRHPYTRGLIAAIPVMSESWELVAIPGQQPPPGLRPSGCAFHPRCPAAIAGCADTVPDVVNLTSDHQVRCQRAQELQPRPSAGRPLAVRHPVSGEQSPLLRVVGLNASHQERRILRDVDLELHPHECLAVVGESGSGKTTLARCLIGLHRPTGGILEFKGRALPTEARKRSGDDRRAMQYIFQSPYNSLNPRRTVGDSLRFPLDIFFALSRAEKDAQVAAALERVSLSPRTAMKYPSQMSGGERQRVAIARALVCHPDVLICDEITSALDVSVQAAIVHLLRDLQDEHGLALLFVTHNLALVRTVADRVLTLNEGRVVEVGNVTDVLARPQAPYTRMLIENTPQIAFETAY
jgi:peptide/nickel transport system ATP-binding protein